MNQTLRHVALSLAVLLVIGGGWYAFHIMEQGKASQPPPQDPLVVAQASNLLGLSPQAATAAGVAAAAPFSNLYRNATYGFSFRYPGNLKIGEYTPQGGDTTTILAQNVSQHIGFQIYITPFSDSDTDITAGRIAHDLPNLAISDAQVAQIGASSRGLAFLTKDPSFGESRQVWIVYQRHLYQISTYSSQDVLLQKVLATWVFGR